ncbi:MAG: hypothetical protein ACYC3Q_00635 [Gemmatimonadaceae bacterium]
MILVMLCCASFVRRLTACVLALCFGLFAVEALVAEVHDPDATRAELVRTGAVTATHQQQGDRAPSDSGQAQLACHCVHAHGSPAEERVTLAMDADARPIAPRVLADKAPPTRSDEPQLRPPIA